MRFFTSCAFAVFALLSGTAGVAFAADEVAGRDAYRETCAVCHGAGGASVIPANPILGGQGEEYLAAQLKKYRSGELHNAVMSPMAANLQDEDIDNIARYLALQPPVIAGAADLPTAEAGENLYRGGNIEREIPACAACHGVAGAGIAPLYPRIAGQYAVYTASALRAYASGERSSVSGIMEDIAGRLTADDIEKLSAYISGLSE